MVFLCDVVHVQASKSKVYLHVAESQLKAARTLTIGWHMEVISLTGCDSNSKKVRDQHKETSGMGWAVVAEGEASLTPGCRRKGLLVGKPRERDTTKHALTSYREAFEPRGSDLACPLYLQSDVMLPLPLLCFGGIGGQAPEATLQQVQAPGGEAVGASELNVGASVPHGRDGDGAVPSPKRQRRLSAGWSDLAGWDLNGVIPARTRSGQRSGQQP